jgi:hypothetical protein
LFENKYKLLDEDFYNFYYLELDKVYTVVKRVLHEIKNLLNMFNTDNQLLLSSSNDINIKKLSYITY